MRDGSLKPQAAGRAGYGIQFWVLISAQVLSQFADSVAQAGIAKTLIFDPAQAETPSAVAKLLAASVIPYSIVGPFAGIAIDRWSRRRILAATGLFRGALLLSAPWLGVSGALLYPAVVLLLSAGRLFLTAKGACLAGVLHERRLLAGNSVSASAGMLSAMAGGAAGLSLVLLFSPSAAYVVAGFCYVASGLLSNKLKLLDSPTLRSRLSASTNSLARMLADLTGGVQEILRTPAALVSLCSIGALRAFVLLTSVGMILIFKDVPTPGALPEVTRTIGLTGIALGAAGVATLGGAVTVRKLSALIPNGVLILASLLVSALAVAALGPFATPSTAIAMALILGYAFGIVKVCADTTIQRTLPDEMRGRAFSFYDLAYNVAALLGATVLAIAYPLWTLPSLFGGAGAVFMATSMAIGVWMKRIRFL